MITPNTNENINMKDILKDWISSNEVQKLSNVLKNIDTENIKQIDSRFTNSLNNVTFSEILKGVSQLSSNPQINKTILKNLVVNLWKYDQKSNSINKNPQEYIDLITNIVWWWNTAFLDEQQRYQQTQENYKKISDELLKDQKLLNKYSLWNEIINKNSQWDIANSDFVTAFKKDYPDSNALEPSQCIVYLEKKVAKFKKGVLAASNMLSLQKNNLQQFNEQIKNNQELSNLIAEMNQLSLKTTPEINYQELRNKAITSIWALSKINIWLGQRTFDKILKQTEKDIRSAENVVLESVIRNKLQEARWLSNHPMLSDEVKKEISSTLNNIEKELWLNNNLLYLDKTSNYEITVDDYLNTTNNESLQTMWQDPKFEKIYNKVFDLWYQKKLTEQQKNAFKNILWLEQDVTLDFIYIDKNSQNPTVNLDPALGVYPHGERVIRSSKKNKEWKIQYDYTTFGLQSDLNKELAQGLVENQQELDNLFGEDMQIKNLFTPITKENKADFQQFNQWQLQIAAYGWPEAISVLFDKKGSDFIKYLKNKTTIENKDKDGKVINTETKDNFLMILDACKNAKSSNDKLDIQERDQYLLNMFDGIKGDKELVAKYVWLINKDTSYMWSNFLTRKNISTWLQSLIGNDKLLNPDTDWDLVKNILTIQSTIQIEAQKPLTKMNIQEQLKKYVWVLFSHPIGKMVLGLLDNFFGWKWWLISKFGKIPGFTDELNKQFKKEFSLNEKQVSIINSLDDQYFMDKDWKKVEKPFYEKKEKSINEIKNEFKYDILLDEFFDENWKIKTYEDDNNKKRPVLDIRLLNNYFTKNKNENWQITLKDDAKTKISYSELFSVDSTTKEVSLKENVDTNTLRTYLHHILLDESTTKAILDADNMFKDNNKKDHFTDGRQSGIYSEAGYARFAAAYLMGGSKWDGKLHYVMSESPVDVDEALDNNNDKTDQLSAEKQNFIDQENIVTWNLNKVTGSDTYESYKFKDTESFYQYKADAASPIKEYQTDILLPMSTLFIGTNSIAKNNFEFLLDDFDWWKDISDVEFLKDSYHLRNMLEYAQGSYKENIVVGENVLDNITKMQKIEKDNNSLIFSDGEWNIIKMYYNSDKLNVEYKQKTS